MIQKNTNKKTKLVFKNKNIQIKESIVDTAYNAAKGLGSDIGKAYKGMFTAAKRLINTYVKYPLNILFKVIIKGGSLKELNKEFISSDTNLSNEFNNIVSSMSGADDAKFLLMISRPDVLFTTPAINQFRETSAKVKDYIFKNEEDSKFFNERIKLMNFFIFIYKSITGKSDIETLKEWGYGESERIKNDISRKLESSYSTLNKFFSTREVKDKLIEIIKKINKINSQKQIFDEFQIKFLNSLYIEGKFREIKTIEKIIVQYKRDEDKKLEKIEMIKYIISTKEELLQLFKQKVSYNQEKEKKDKSSDNKKTDTATPTPDTSSQQEQLNNSFKLILKNNNIKILKEENEESDKEQTSKNNIDEMKLEELMQNVGKEIEYQYQHFFYVNLYLFCCINNLYLTTAYLYYNFYIEYLDNLKNQKTEFTSQNLTKINEISNNNELINYLEKLNSDVKEKNVYQNHIDIDKIEDSFNNFKKSNETMQQELTQLVAKINGVFNGKNENQKKALFIELINETKQQLEKLKQKDLSNQITNSISILEKLRSNILIEKIGEVINYSKEGLDAEDRFNQNIVNKTESLIKNILSIREKANSFDDQKNNLLKELSDVVSELQQAMQQTKQTDNTSNSGDDSNTTDDDANDDDANDDADEKK